MTSVNLVLSEDNSCMYLGKFSSGRSLMDFQLLFKSCRYFLAILFALLFFNSNATVYYVSSSGNDANPGTSEALPWKTLAKVNNFTPSPGDQILFKRGDQWSGNISVKASGA